MHQFNPPTSVLPKTQLSPSTPSTWTTYKTQVWTQGGILKGSMNSFASPIPYESPAQEKLVTIVQELTGVTSKHTILNQQLWSNLPYFPAGLPQTWQLSPDANDEEKTRRFVNLQAYAAPIIGLGLAPLTIYAIWALSNVAEGVMLPVGGSPDVVETMDTVEGHSSYRFRPHFQVTNRSVHTI